MDIKSYKSLKDLKSFAESQQLLITKLMSDVKTRETDIEHLKRMLIELGNKKIQVFDSAPSEEELICIEQITRLKEMSTNALLSSKEVESLERLVRTLRSIRKPDKKDDERDALPAPLTKSELLELAAGSSEPFDER